MDLYETERKIKKALNVFSMVNKGDSVLVGFSGGKDSVVLLHALNSMAKEYGIAVYALHVNHNIRGEEAKRDEIFCETFCKKNNIPFDAIHVYAVDYAEKNKIGLEEAARILRYNAFSNMLTEKNIKKIATAHTASDNLETVLFNLTRGSALEGLKGIPPVRDNIIRPLIYCTTDDVLEYAKRHNLDYVTDSTNSDTDYARNHIRHNVIPLIKKLNPSAENAISNMCDGIRKDLDYISQNTESIKTDRTAELAKLHPSMLSRVLLREYKKAASNGSLENVHLSEMTELVYGHVNQGCKSIKKLSLPKNTDMIVAPDRVYFEKHRENPSLAQHPLKLGLNLFDETGEALLVTDDEKELDELLSKNIYKKYIHTVVKKSSLAGTIIRGRQDGDVFEFSNMTKKVKKMMNEAKIPIFVRDKLPFVCDRRGIIWIPHFPVRDDAKPVSSNDTVNIYYLTSETEK